VLAVPGPDRPPGHQQPITPRPGDGERVDDSQVHPGGPRRVRLLPQGAGGDGDLGGHVRVQATVGMAEGNRPDLTGRVGDVPVQPRDQRRAASCGGQPQHPAVQGEGAVVETCRHDTPEASTHHPIDSHQSSQMN